MARGLVDTSPFDLGEADDCRVPDRGVHRTRPSDPYVPTAALVVEIVSPHDESWAKLGSYAAHQVDEVVMVAATALMARAACNPDTSTWSEHSYGTAIDINPVRNPYVQGSSVAPPAGRDWTDRPHQAPGMIAHGDPVWGGRVGSAGASRERLCWSALATSFLGGGPLGPGSPVADGPTGPGGPTVRGCGSMRRARCGRSGRRSSTSWAR